MLLAEIMGFQKLFVYSDLVGLCKMRYFFKACGCEKYFVSLQAKSPNGGIGRRVGLKHQCRKACRFDPGSGYKLKSIKFSTLCFFCN